jgi:hypothetical protein
VIVSGFSAVVGIHGSIVGEIHATNILRDEEVGHLLHLVVQQMLKKIIVVKKPRPGHGDIASPEIKSNITSWERAIAFKFRDTAGASPIVLSLQIRWQSVLRSLQ